MEEDEDEEVASSSPEAGLELGRLLLLVLREEGRASVASGPERETLAAGAARAKAATASAAAGATRTEAATAAAAASATKAAAATTSAGSAAAAAQHAATRHHAVLREVLPSMMMIVSVTAVSESYAR
jgi:hypothetical protein